MDNSYIDEQGIVYLYLPEVDQIIYFDLPNFNVYFPDNFPDNRCKSLDKIMLSGAGVYVNGQMYMRKYLTPNGPWKEYLERFLQLKNFA